MPGQKRALVREGEPVVGLALDNGVGAVGWVEGILRIGSIILFLFFPMVLAATGFATAFALLAFAPIVIAAVTLIIRWEPIGVGELAARPAAVDRGRWGPAILL